MKRNNNKKDKYGDESGHEFCDKCCFCITCGDCKKFGCGLFEEIY